MRNLICVLIIYALSLNLYAYRESYNVYGYDENGQLVRGVVNTNDQDWEVRGQLVDVEGDADDFYGRWNGPGKITGQTDEGEELDLKTY